MVGSNAFMDCPVFKFPPEGRKQIGCFAELRRLGGIEEVITIGLTNGQMIFGINHNMIASKKIEAKDDIC